MVFLRILKHIGIVAAGVILIIGVPLWCTGYITSLFSDEPDITSSASIAVDQPSGNFVVLINKKYHTNQSNLEKWERFFSGDYGESEAVIIFEDIACSVASGDTTAKTMATSFQTTELGNGQMQVNEEDATLLVSRADNGKFDIIVMSAEFADAYNLQTAYNDDVVVIHVQGNAADSADADSEDGSDSTENAGETSASEGQEEQQ